MVGEHEKNEQFNGSLEVIPHLLQQQPQRIVEHLKLGMEGVEQNLSKTSPGMWGRIREDGEKSEGSHSSSSVVST